MKIKLHITLVSIFLLILSNTVSAQIFNLNGLQYIVTSGTNVSVGKGTNPCPTGVLTIPSTVTFANIDYTVTSIVESAFFECTALTSVIIPNSVTSIGNSAFLYCYVLTSVTIPNSVISIGSDAFGFSALTSVTIPNSVISIGELAFEYCSALTSVTIGNSVTSIGGGAFARCVALPSVIIPNSVTSIGNDTFRDCTGLTSVTIGNSVTSIGETAFFSCMVLTSVTIPNSVTSIGGYAFYACTGLTSITIPNSVTSIGEAAFAFSGLTSVTIPNSVTSINIQAFSNCTALTSVNVSWATPLSITSDVFQNITLSGVTLNVAAPGVLTDYQTVNVWKDFGTIVLSATSFQQNNNVKLYPNPAKEFVTFSGLVEKEKYTIYNLLGAKLSTGIIDSDQKINTQNLTNGIYFIQLENGNSIKFIKE